MQYVSSIVIGVLAFLLGNVIRPFFSSYANKKGENLATKEDIAQITKTQEEIKSQISDKTWDRQRQWELKRDAVLDAIRAYTDLESALVTLNSSISLREKVRTDETDAEWKAAIQRFRKSRTIYRRAYLIADAAAGEPFSIALSEYFLLTGAVVKDLTPQKTFLDQANSKELALSGKNVILSARTALGIKNAGELPIFGDSN
jgi:hypothetical protein